VRPARILRAWPQRQGPRNFWRWRPSLPCSLRAAHRVPWPIRPIAAVCSIDVVSGVEVDNCVGIPNADTTTDAPGYFPEAAIRSQPTRSFTTTGSQRSLLAW
jgi:hypothetical protein